MARACETAYLAAVAEQLGLGIPLEEVERLAPVLSTLLAECRALYGEGLWLVDPVGAFRPETRVAADER